MGRKVLLRNLREMKVINFFLIILQCLIHVLCTVEALSLSEHQSLPTESHDEHIPQKMTDLKYREPTSNIAQDHAHTTVSERLCQSPQGSVFQLSKQFCVNYSTSCLNVGFLDGSDDTLQHGQGIRSIRVVL